MLGVRPSSGAGAASAAPGAGGGGAARDFSAYCDKQQRARLLVPELPTQSRVGDLDRVWEKEQQEEERRAATLAKLDRCAQERAQRLQQTLSKAREEGSVSRKNRPQPSPLTRLSPSSSTTAVVEDAFSSVSSPGGGNFPNSMSPCTNTLGAAAAIACADVAARTCGASAGGSAKFLGRRLDVNRVRLRQVQAADEQRRLSQQSLAKEAKRLADVLQAIDEFEDGLPSSRRTQDASVVGRTSEDWTGTRPTRKPCAARMRAPCPEVTAAAGWTGGPVTDLASSTPSARSGKRRGASEQGSMARAASVPL